MNTFIFTIEKITATQEDFDNIIKTLELEESPESKKSDSDIKQFLYNKELKEVMILHAKLSTWKNNGTHNDILRYISLDGHSSNENLR